MGNCRDVGKRKHVGQRWNPGKKMCGRVVRILCCAWIAAVASGTAMAQPDGTGADIMMEQSPVILMPDGWSEEAGGPGTEETQPQTIRIQGTVKEVQGDAILVADISGDSQADEILLHTSVFDTWFVDAKSGYPADLAAVQAGDTVYAEIREAMTDGLLPQITAEVVLCKVPVDYIAPEYVITESMEWQTDESWILTLKDGTSCQVPKDCPVISYNMNQLSTFRIISESSKLLVWIDGEGQAERIVKLPARW